jgi:hypothetical protein
VDPFIILAQTTEPAQATTTEVFAPVDVFWQQVTSLGLPEALMFISFGAVCLMYGWRVFKILVVISFALLGMVIGAMAAAKITGANNQILGGFIGLVLFGALAMPLMRWGVSILGALAGGIVTAGMWYAFELPEKYIWAGGLIGIIAGGMIAFIALKWAVILFSSLGGAALLITGLFALFYLWEETSEQIQQLVFEQNWFLPVAVVVPTALGFILQHKFVKRSSQWSI